MKKMLYITNIPTPYRNYRFNKMVALFREQGISLEVLYMNASEPDRNWVLDKDAMRHPYQIFSTRKVGNGLGMWLHTSLKLQWYLLRADYDVAVLGGLASPAHFMASLLLKKGKVNVLSVESNMDSIANKGGLATKVKQYLMRRFAFFQVTGERSIEFIAHYVPDLDREKVLTLPNVIDEEVFANTNTEVLPTQLLDKIQEQKSQGNRVILIPARLIEVKGLLPFLTCLRKEDKVFVVIAGEGELRPQIEKLIRDNELNVSLLGEVNQAQVAGLMKLTDFMALPSRSDASPLSVIEAISCGVPLLVSRNIGNINDVLKTGVNGWSFAYDNPAQTRAAISSALTVTEPEYQEMRTQAVNLFKQRFATDVVLKNYLDSLKRMMN